MSVIETEWRRATKRLPARVVAKWLFYEIARPGQDTETDHAITARELADSAYQTPSDWYCAGRVGHRMFFVADTRLAFRCTGVGKKLGDKI